MLGEENLIPQSVAQEIKNINKFKDINKHVVLSACVKEEHHLGPQGELWCYIMPKDCYYFIVLRLTTTILDNSAIIYIYNKNEHFRKEYIMKAPIAAPITIDKLNTALSDFSDQAGLETRLPPFENLIMTDLNEITEKKMVNCFGEEAHLNGMEMKQAAIKIIRAIFPDRAEHILEGPGLGTMDRSVIMNQIRRHARDAPEVPSNALKALSLASNPGFSISEHLPFKRNTTRGGKRRRHRSRKNKRTRSKRRRRM